MSHAKVAGARPLSLFLRMAVMAGVESAVQIHIDRGDDLDARDASGMTPLMLSAVRNKPAICRLLLSAGADCELLDPSGKTALEIALAAGSRDTAAILHAVRATIPPVQASSVDISTKPDLVIDISLAGGQLTQEATADIGISASTEPTESETPVPLPEPARATSPSVVIEIVEDEEFDLSGWEAQEEATPPEANLVVKDSASAIQSAITSHEPIDSSAAWDDIDAYLPDQALPLARADDAEARALLRRLLLRAIREGSVPGWDVQTLSINEDRSPNPEAEAFLAMVINDLGAEIDERFEYADADESFEVFIDPAETPDEEATLDEALGAIDRAAWPRHKPLHIYQREFQRLPLLTAEEEIELAQIMEGAIEGMLDALAAWPAGIASTLAAGGNAIAGLRPLSSIWLGDAEPDPEVASAGDMNAAASETDASEDAMDEDGEPAASAPADAGFADALSQLGSLTERGDGSKSLVPQIRKALTALSLNRRFLLELGDTADGPAPCPGFTQALSSFRKARDRMTAANLKLAFFHAKKYLYSGEPLDDLAQEGNIGLLKAVDRYDWRRGFRFSTYATWWIRQQIGRHVADKARTIRVPIHIYEKTQRLRRFADTFEKSFRREPTLHELAELMEMPAHRVSALLRIPPEPSRIDEMTVDDMISIDARDAYSTPDPADVVDKIQLRSAVNRLISSLSSKDGKAERILRLRFGIGINAPLTLEEVGQRFDVTRERIRQIEAQAITKLRHPARSEPFARLALGINLDTAKEESESADAIEAHERSAESVAPKRQSTPRSARETARPPNQSGQSSVDRLLAQATKLGISVEDGRSNSSGRIWVNLVHTPDNLHRRLARALLKFGFESWPGKGYWK